MKEIRSYQGSLKKDNPERDDMKRRHKKDVIFSESYPKCVTTAGKVGEWMRESVTIFQSNPAASTDKTDRFYFRLEKDPRPIIERDWVRQTLEYSPESGKCLPN